MQKEESNWGEGCFSSFINEFEGIGIIETAKRICFDKQMV
jgi:hypothetical protein